MLLHGRGFVFHLCIRSSVVMVVHACFTIFYLFGLNGLLTFSLWRCVKAVQLFAYNFSIRSYIFFFLFPVSFFDISICPLSNVLTEIPSSSITPPPHLDEPSEKKGNSWNWIHHSPQTTVWRNRLRITRKRRQESKVSLHHSGAIVTKFFSRQHLLSQQVH